jgi:DNA ligase D-like protein (predicted ligase)
MSTLPDFVAPMLAKLGDRAFDSDRHLFEVKWDGFRMLAFVDAAGRYRLLSRRRQVMTARYPELAPLGRLPAGVILDGEVVALGPDQRPDFEALLGRGTRGGGSARTGAAVVYVAFDLLYVGAEPILERPLEERRELLSRLVADLGDARVVFSTGVHGAGQRLFAEARARGLEGLVAKRLGSRYLPGRRTDAWIKIKAPSHLLCAIVGWLSAGRDDLKSLIVAAPDEAGTLRVVGRVGSGLGEPERRRLVELLRARPRSTPIAATEEAGIWVEPGLYCEVAYAERTKGGMLRAPVFERLIVDDG